MMSSSTGRSVIATACLSLSLLCSGADAATLPPGFTERLVVGGLTNPTAMAFAPDGRLFVCQQGGQMRVIKNGALLPDAVSHADRRLRRRARAARHRVRPGVRHATVRLRLLHGRRRPAIHNRVSRFTANGDVAAAGSEIVLLELRQSERRHQPQRRRDPLRAGRQALHRGRRERERRQRADARQPARQDAAHQRGRHDPGRQSVLQHGHRGRTAPSGRSACATRSPSRSSPARAACSSTTSGRTPGRRSTTASPAPTTAGRTAKGPTPSIPKLRAAPVSRRRCTHTTGA